MIKTDNPFQANPNWPQKLGAEGEQDNEFVMVPTCIITKLSLLGPRPVGVGAISLVVSVFYSMLLHVTGKHWESCWTEHGAKGEHRQAQRTRHRRWEEVKGRRIACKKGARRSKFQL